MIKLRKTKNKHVHGAEQQNAASPYLALTVGTDSRPLVDDQRALDAS